MPNYLECVCFVYARMGGVFKPVGTAFYLRIDDGPLFHNYVVTALHVVANVHTHSDDKTTYLRVNAKDGGFRIVEVSESSWWRPDFTDGVIKDVAFCPLQTLDGVKEWHFRAIGAELAATSEVIEAEQLGVGNEVAMIGLFVNHHGRDRNEPIARFGNICAVPTELVSTKVGDIEAYLVEARSAGGLSGSPVFVDAGLFRVVDNVRQYRQGGGPVMFLLGLMNGHWDAFVDKSMGEGGASAEYVNKGVAVVTPIDVVLNVIRRSPYGRAMAELRKRVEAGLSPSDYDDQGRYIVAIPWDAPDDEDDARLPNS
ncbi:hypothetical protein [Mycolicibacterium neoaurum]|uniref:hypothetical protein n=1 Tax=Mycolicibacterium neoaurum TaxID=1795 RepID=UPI001F4D1943|nr:hypothetical protein [Mycolicibacterium neoaurum]